MMARHLVDEDSFRRPPGQGFQPHGTGTGEDVQHLRLQDAHIGQYIEDAFPHPSQGRSRILPIGRDEDGSFRASTNNIHR